MEKQLSDAVVLESGFNQFFMAHDYGTILYLKGKDNVVRECKVVGAVYCYDKNDRNEITYEYKVAGMNGTFIGKGNQVEIGAIYPTRDIAIHSSAKYQCIDVRLWAPTLNRQYIIEELVDKYGLTRNNIYDAGMLRPKFEFYGIKINDDNTMPYKQTQVEIYMDRYGWHANIPDFDNGILFATKEEADEHISPKVVSFDDNDTDSEEEQELLEITIKVKKDKLAELKKIGIEI